MIHHRNPTGRPAWLAGLLALWLAGSAGAALPGPDVVPMQPGLRLNALSERPDSDLVQLGDGKRVRLGDLRRFDQAARRLRGGPATAVVPAPLRHQPAASGFKVDDQASLAEALRRPDSDTVVLPSGRRATVGQLRYAQPRAEMRLGRPLVAQPPAANRTGPAVKVDARSDWKAILARPDQTVLESPAGRRITVGELKQAIRSGALSRSAAPRR